MNHHNLAHQDNLQPHPLPHLPIDIFAANRSQADFQLPAPSLSVSSIITCQLNCGCVSVLALIVGGWSGSGRSSMWNDPVKRLYRDQGPAGLNGPTVRVLIAGRVRPFLLHSRPSLARMVQIFERAV